MTPDEMMQAASLLAKATDEEVLATLEAVARLYKKRAGKAWNELTHDDHAAFSSESSAKERQRRLASVVYNAEHAVEELTRLIAGRNCHQCLVWGDFRHAEHTEEERREHVPKRRAP